MLPPQEISIYLDNALKANLQQAQLEIDEPLPDTCAAMPERVAGRFLDLEPATVDTIRSARKRVMILNRTEVLYSFSFDPDAGTFVATIR